MRWLLISRGIRSVSQALLIVIVPLYLAAAHYSAAQVGYLLSIASLGSVILVLAVGFVADRYGRKPVLITIALFATLGAVVYALTTSFWPLAIMAALGSVGRGGSAGSGGNWGPFFPAEQPLIAGSVPPADRNTAFAILSIVGVVCGAVGSLVGGLPDILTRLTHVSLLTSFRAVFWVSAALGLLLVLAIVPIRETSTSVGGRESRMSRATFGLLVRLWLTNGLNGLAFGVLGPFLTYWMSVRFGVDSAALGTLYAVVNIATVPSYVASPDLARKLGSVRTIVVTRVGSVIALAALTAAPTFTFASGCFLVRMLFVSAGMPIRQSFVMGVSDEKSRSRVAALGNLPSQFTSTVSPSLAGYLLENVSMEAPLWLATVVSAANAVSYGLFFRNLVPPEERQRARLQTASSAWSQSTNISNSQPAPPNS